MRAGIHPAVMMARARLAGTLRPVTPLGAVWLRVSIRTLNDFTAVEAADVDSDGSAKLVLAQALAPWRQAPGMDTGRFGSAARVREIRVAVGRT